MTDFASRLQELELHDPGLYLHILSYVDGDMTREQYANFMHKEMSSTINGALVDEDVFLKVAGMLTSYQKIVGFGNEALFLAVNLAKRYVMHAVHPAVELPLVVLAALLLSMKLCDANFISRRQVHKLALAVAFALEQLVQKERQMVQVVRGRIWSSTPWTFLSTCVIDDELRAVAESVMVLSLGSASVNRYASSQIAAGAVCVGNLVLGRKSWSEAEEDQT